MKTLFYLVGIFPIIFELMTVMQIKKVYNFNKKIMEKKDNKIPLTDWEDKEKTYAVYQMGYVVWVVIGLFTVNWPLFLLILILGALPFMKKNIVTYWIDGLLTLSLLLLITLNSHYFNLDIFEYIKSLF